MAGMMGLRRCSRCRMEAAGESEGEETQLDTEDVELAEVSFGRESGPPGT